MYFIYVLFGCATVSPNATSTSSSSTVLSSESQTTMKTLGAIDLSEEFGSELQGWTYRLQHLENPNGSSFTLSNDTGWALIEDGELIDSGIVPVSTPYEQCVSGCSVLVVDVKNEEGSTSQNSFLEQELSGDAPSSSVGLTVLDTWDAPLSGLADVQKKLRFRAVRIEPNGLVGQHKHSSRPSFAYVLSGDVTEHRGDGDVVHQANGVVAEQNGLVHWWENDAEDTIILVFDLIDA